MTDRHNSWAFNNDIFEEKEVFVPQEYKNGTPKNIQNAEQKIMGVKKVGINTL